MNKDELHIAAQEWVAKNAPQKITFSQRQLLIAAICFGAEYVLKKIKEPK